MGNGVLLVSSLLFVIRTCVMQIKQLSVNADSLTSKGCIIFEGAM